MAAGASQICGCRRGVGGRREIWGGRSEEEEGEIFVGGLRPSPPSSLESLNALYDGPAPISCPQ
jgi:hypothetical protein